MESSQKNLCVGISLLGGVVGAVLAVMLAVGGLNASGSSVVYAFLGCLLTWAAASAALVKRPMVRKRGNTLTAMLILFLGLCLRLALFDYQSPDYVSFLSVWTQTMRGMTVREALTTPVGDYNMPYLYLILLISRLPFSDVYCIKLFSVMADAVAALAVGYLTMRLTKREGAALFTVTAALFCPTTWLNSGYWGQCDSVYVALGLWGLYAGLRGRSKSCWLLFALSLSVKLQAIFLLPILTFLLVDGRIKLRDFWVFPAAFIGASLPALLAGRSISDTFSIYLSQTQAYPYLSLNAPSFWALIDNSFFTNMAGAPVLLAMSLSLCVLLLFLRRAEKLDERALVSLSLLFCVMIPWLLPRMHERYFYLAEMLALVYGAVYPRRLYAPVVLMAGGFLVYSRYLFGTEPYLSLRTAAAIYGVLLLSLFIYLLRDTEIGNKSAAQIKGGNEHGISME